MSWPAPNFSKNRVRKAGKAVASTMNSHRGLLLWNVNIPFEEYQVIENWRASHGAVLNTAQAWLRRLEKDQSPIVAQRLKRFDTIVDKLATGRARDLSTMNDIAGLRLIFRSEAELLQFREKMDASRAKHKRTHDPNRFDYIMSPKSTGYRGIHDVFERRVKSEPNASLWDGLKFEVQLRTFVQHAWATAVEVYDSIKRHRFKFQKSDDAAYEQFLLISELLARVHEGRNSCLPNHTDMFLVNRISVLEQESGMITMFRSLSAAQHYQELRENSILQRTNENKLFIYTFRTFSEAARAVAEIEQREETIDAVLVAARTPQHIRDAFRNYFDDTSDFIELLDDAKRRVIAKDAADEWNTQPKEYREG